MPSANYWGQGKKMKNHHRLILLLVTAIFATNGAVIAAGDDNAVIAVANIGTGDMGNSLGPRFAELGYRVVYGSRNPGTQSAQHLVALTGEGASITTQEEAAQAREIEALQRLYMVPLIQRRKATWEPYFRRSYYWECLWQDDYSEPFHDAGKLAVFPETQGPPKDCPGTGVRPSNGY